MPCSLEFPASQLRVPSEHGMVYLRLLEVSDAPEIVSGLQESLAELRAFLPFAHQPLTVESQVRRLSEARAPLDMAFGLFQRAGGASRLLGGCGLHPRVPLNPAGTEIGFWTRTAENGRGWATLMARLLVIYAFDGLGMDRVQIGHNVENLASQRVIEKCGFILEGRVRNALPAPAREAVLQGLSACRDVLQYALLPQEARRLEWYAPLSDSIQVIAT